MLLNRLQDHMLGDVKLSATQIKAAEILLRKVLPDLASTELSGAVERTTVIRAPESVADSKTWLERHGPAQEQVEPRPGKPDLN